jgi:pimeloyl-ACP methyl ester carboxylesterase
MEAPDQTVRARDIDVHVVRVGRGSPLVVCGGPQLGHAYLRDFDALSDERELIYFDARGSGRTNLGDPSQLTLAGAIEDLEGLREALGIERFSLVGHSLGGHIAYPCPVAGPGRRRAAPHQGTGRGPVESDAGPAHPGR